MEKPRLYDRIMQNPAFEATLAETGNVLVRSGTVPREQSPERNIAVNSQTTIEQYLSERDYMNPGVAETVMNMEASHEYFPQVETVVVGYEAFGKKKYKISDQFFSPFRILSTGKKEDRDALSHGSIFLFQELASEAILQSAQRVEYTVPLVKDRFLESALKKIQEYTQDKERSDVQKLMEINPSEIDLVVQGTRVHLSKGGKNLVTMMGNMDTRIRLAAIAELRQNFLKNMVQRNVWFQLPEKLTQENYRNEIGGKIAQGDDLIVDMSSPTLLRDYLSGAIGTHMLDVESTHLFENTTEEPDGIEMEEGYEHEMEDFQPQRRKKPVRRQRLMD